ncbi:uncharacterized protein LOC118438900 [Folsomia candida]|uniref:uncharacterized protein LOC118438900 n=1 Tax=Folsomia candida TaxID=158441 RepID=UPI001604C718|nr:uncharacterized protein LOC118438900 [Folsomia candida]
MEDSNYTKSTGHHMILRWVNNKLFTTKKLFMVDVDPEDTFYPRKSYICQFPRASECHIHSVEEQHARELIAGKDEPYIMGYFESRELDVVSNILQFNYTDALKFCQDRDMNLLDMRITAANAEELFEQFNNFGGNFDIICNVEPRLNFCYLLQVGCQDFG